MATKFVTKLSQDMGVNDTFCVVENATQFPEEGNITIGAEDCEYSGRMSKSFSGIRRGLRNTIQKKHKAGTVVVFEEAFNPVTDAYTKVLDRLGQDIYLDANGDIFIDEGGDIKISSGIETLDVRLRIRVNSMLGIGINPGVGVQSHDGVVDERVLASSVVDAIQADDDVGKVDDVKTLRDGDILYVSMNVYVQGLSDGFQFVYKINTSGFGA